MKSIKKALIYGFFVWLFPFIIAVIIFPLHEKERALFESIMPVATTTTVVLFSILYFKKVEGNFVKEGLWLGIVYFAISIMIDLLMFSKGPMAMPLLEYVKDIGLTYLLFFPITIGMGYVIERRKQ